MVRGRKGNEEEKYALVNWYWNFNLYRKKNTEFKYIKNPICLHRRMCISVEMQTKSDEAKKSTTNNNDDDDIWLSEWAENR